MREVRKTAVHNEWPAAEIQEASDDPRPSIPHDETMAEMDAEIVAVVGTGRRAPHAEGKV